MSYHARMARLLAGTVIGTIGTATIAGAQDASETEVAQATTLLNQLVVGTGHDKVAIDTPQAVTVLDQEAIDEKQAATIAELFDQVPGVTMIG
ncbi:MAG: TonB-dependent receptor plug domain-containing protein, partial [Roseibium sp.]